MMLGFLLCIAALLPTVARAEEAPVDVPLSYIANFSNYGPTTATGTAEVWRKDAEVRLVVNGLPQLSTQKYACWLVNQQAGSFLTVGRFNVSSNGSAVIDVTLHGSLPAGYTMVLITVQPDPDTSTTTPSKLYSIAGYFQGNAPVATKVVHLPDTGVNAEHPTFSPLYKPPAAAAASTFDGINWRHIISYGLLAVSVACVALLIRRNRKLKDFE
jgi:hypothetical protein